MSIFNETNYKTLILKKTKEKRSYKGHFTFEKLANHCRVQKTYLSKVLNHEGNLSRDQLYLACDYLEFGNEEKEFVFLLYEENTTVVPKRRLELKNQINQIKSQHLKSESRIEVKKISATQEYLNYYLDPYLQVLHMAFTISRYQKNITEIYKLFPELNVQVLNEKIKQLKSLSLIVENEKSFRALEATLHLSQDAPLYENYRSSLRLKSIDKMSTLQKNKSYSFSVIFSSDKKTKEKIHNIFLDFLSQTQKMVKSSNEEEIYQLNFDLFDWS